MTHSAENDATEYRVMWLHKASGQWRSHTGEVTQNPDIARAWLNQARHRDGGAEARVETRTVQPWCPIPRECAMSEHTAESDRAAILAVLREHWPESGGQSGHAAAVKAQEACADALLTRVTSPGEGQA